MCHGKFYRRGKISPYNDAVLIASREKDGERFMVDVEVLIADEADFLRHF
jgi:hypothetical protein